MALDTATGSELLAIRTRLKMLIRRLVGRIDVMYGIQGRLRFCRLTVQLSNGEVRVIHSARNGVEYNHVEDALGTTEVWRLRITA